jgi:hypothetical protein
VKEKKGGIGKKEERKTRAGIQKKRGRGKFR